MDFSSHKIIDYDSHAANLAQIPEVDNVESNLEEAHKDFLQHDQTVDNADPTIKITEIRNRAIKIVKVENAVGDEITNSRRITTLFIACN